jgi:hypothetical protein
MELLFGAIEMSEDKLQLATVTLPEVGAHGVFFSDGLVLTTAKLVTDKYRDALAPGSRHFERIETRTGFSFRMQIVYVEPFSNIAVLAAPLGNDLLKRSEFALDYLDWHKFTFQLNGLKRDNYYPPETDVRVLLNDGQWAKAKANHRDDVMVFVGDDAAKASWGSPIVSIRDDEPHLWAIIASETDAENHGGFGEDEWGMLHVDDVLPRHVGNISRGLCRMNELASAEC